MQAEELPPTDPRGRYKGRQSLSHAAATPPNPDASQLSSMQHTSRLLFTRRRPRRR